MSGNSTHSAAGSAAKATRDERLNRSRSHVGRTLAGRWRLNSVLGVGGTATVYGATHRNGRSAAVKVLHAELALNPIVVRRFLSEGYAANKVRHPGAVLVLDDGEDQGMVFLVLELLKGRSLADRFESEGVLKLEEVASALASVLEVLAAAHANGVVHRDVKPSNVFQLNDGTIKLLDFGVARVRDAETSSVTQSGISVGTPAFMAPEQAAGRFHEVDALTDIWAVGASMFQLLSGSYVHNATSSNALIVAAATVPAPPVRSRCPDLPVDVAAVIDRALAFRKGERWPNARAMREALAQAMPGTVERMPPAVEADTSTEFHPPVASRRRVKVMSVAVAFVAVALLAAAGVATRASEAPTRNDQVTSKTHVAVPSRPTTVESVSLSRVEASEPPIVPTLPSAPARLETKARRLPSPRSSATILDHSAPTGDHEERILDRRK